MKLTHKLDYTGKANPKKHMYAGELYVHSWYSDEEGPHKGDRLGWQELIFSTKEQADTWLSRQSTT